MWPILLRIPWTEVDVPTWGALLVLGLAVGIGVAAKMAVRDGVDPAATVRAGLVVVASALVGVQVMGYVDGSHGRVLWGGIIAGIAATLASARAFGIGRLALVDAGAVGLAFGIAIGRVGCFAGGCCAGTVCSMPWGVTYPAATVDAFGYAYLLPHHPTQLYEAALAAAIGFYLVRLHARRTFEGQAALAFLVLYPAARFLVEFWRGDDRGDLFGLTHATGLSPAQLVSLGVLAISSVGLVARAAASHACWREKSCEKPF
jgi:phosphatidylglycerol:prolipoprotein diacylglycerol transferase